MGALVTSLTPGVMSLPSPAYCWTRRCCLSFFFFFNDTATTEIYTLSLHDALPISTLVKLPSTLSTLRSFMNAVNWTAARSEEHTSELQSLRHLVCRLLLEKKKKQFVEEVWPR